MNLNLKFYLYKAFRTPPNKLVSKAFRIIKRAISYNLMKYKDLYADCHINYSKLTLNYSYIHIKNLNISKIDKCAAKYLYGMFLLHNFDILGGGWVNVGYDINPIGVEGNRYDGSLHIKAFDKEGEWLKQILRKQHIPYAKNIWEYIDSKSYNPIDWQIDFKSGYRWDAKKWYKEQQPAPVPGADIKVTWELSRLQHLPQMAIIALALPEEKNNLILEFKNQIFDFIMSNPPRMGTVWTTTMDVGIRVANMLVAYDIFQQLDNNNILGEDFKSIFCRSIYEHGVHIVNNFDWSEILTSNHYLSNISGLLFVSAYLERTEIIDAWLILSIQEIINEMNKQFHSDGSNFEASTCYHRLCSEMMIYNTALIYGILKTDKMQAIKEYNNKIIDRLLPQNKQLFDIYSDDFFPEWYIRKLFGSGLFTADITKQNGEVPQIGDNDNGRFFNLSPIGNLITVQEIMKKYKSLKNYNNFESNNSLYWDENIINHSALISAMNGIFENNSFNNFSQQYPLEKSLIESLANRKKIEIERQPNVFKISKLDLPILPYSKCTEISFQMKNEISLFLKNLEFICYPDFGMYIFKSSQMYLCIMAGENGQNGNAGHTHNDKLSFELNISGVDYYIDPGTYIYSGLCDRRNQFRSVNAHNVIIVDNQEQNDYLTLFAMKDQSRCYLAEYNYNYIKFYLTYKSIQHIRSFEILNDKLIINDFCNKPFEVNMNKGELYSNGYGKLYNCLFN
jgi:hypothetical protein